MKAFDIDQLSEKVFELIHNGEADPDVWKNIAEEIFQSPVLPERDGLLALIYHEGLGVETDLLKSFEYAEKAAFEGRQGIGYYLLGYMCDNAETPDQAEGGPRQKYDQYDAERFYEICARIESPWREDAILWLADYFMNSARGGDPEIGVEYLEQIADHNPIAAGRLADYYWNLVMPDFVDDEEWTAQLFKWTEAAARLDPEEYVYNLGWLYADGIGCDRNPEKAEECFRKAVGFDDWRGAQSLAFLLEQSLDDNPNLDPGERQGIEVEIDRWKTLADKMHSKSLLSDPDERDPALDHDE